MNIFVIEDEPPILREIVAIIQSFQEDYQIIGKAANGQEAMDFLLKNGEQIDVMITDIQIPVMTGLDLISYTHEHFPHILSIILTGFSNFDYAQKAIRWGVFDYLLKPIDEEELHTQLKKAYAKKCLDYIQNHPEESGNKTSPVPSGYQIALLSLGSFPVYASTYNELFPELWKQISLSGYFEQFPDLRDCFWLMDGLSLAEKIILLSAPETASSSPESYLTELFSPLLSTGIPLTIAVDTRFSGIRHVHRSILALRSFINKRVKLGKSQLLFYKGEEASPPEVDFSLFHPYCSHLAELFGRKNIPVFEGELKNYLSFMRSHSLPTAAVYRLLQELFHACIQAGDDDYPELSTLDVQSTTGDVLMLSDSYQSLYENLLSIFLSLFETMAKKESIAKDKTSTLLQVDAYMKEHFTKPINTKSVAEQFGFTPAYLSKIFREYKAVTPADYIIRLRMEKAKELFSSNPSCKIKEVAAFVGYDDSLYFSKVFKKETGQSPKQFLERLSQK